MKVTAEHSLCFLTDKQMRSKREKKYAQGARETLLVGVLSRVDKNKVK